MKIELINYTPNAAATLIYTKSTRLQDEMTLEDVIQMSDEWILEELRYMKDTIQSSWEFVDYTFRISNVSRSFTHQLVRTRTGAYAQESQRTVDVRDATVINTSGSAEFDEAAGYILGLYGQWIDGGMAVQDARGILPSNISTSIISKFNLRTLHDMALLRLCVRTQGEYQRVFKAMIEEVFKVHPWAEEFIRVKCAWDGVCAFPRYSNCPIQRYTLHASDYLKADIQRRWQETTHEAIPVAKNGRTM